jgi:hypothetical protein
MNRTKLQKNSNLYYCIPGKICKILPYFEKSSIAIPGYRYSYLLEILTLLSFNVRKSEGEAPLKMTYLMKLIPQANQYINLLIKCSIIQRTGSYVVGVKSFSYRYTTFYDSRYHTLAVTDPKLIRRLKYYHLKRNQSKKYPDQNKFIRELTIEPKVFKYISSQGYDMDKYNYAVGSVTRIMNGNIFYSVDSTSGRYHSNLTNLPSELRPCVRICGQPVLNIDIKNSQPYLSTLLLTNPGKVARHAKDKKFSMFLESLQGIEALDVTLYVSLVNSGCFYEYIWDEFKKYGLTYPSRDEVKRQVFIILFSRNTIYNKAKEIFSVLFPNVYERFCQVKGYNRGGIFENYKRFAILLQRVESYLVLDNILPRIYREHPGTIAVSIHDSVATSSIMTNNKEIVKRVMNEELINYVGISPILKIEN